MSTDAPSSIAPGRDVILPNGSTATVGLISGLSALVRVNNASAWHPIADLKEAPT